MSSLLKHAADPLPAAEPGLSPDRFRPRNFGDAWRGALARSTAVRPLANIFAGQGTCLMYHRICPDNQAGITPSSRFSPNQDLAVSVSAFNQQMAFLAQNYNCLSLSQALSELRSGSLAPRSVVVTFDDGYLDNLTLALPILRAHGVPATIYVATGLSEQASILWWYEVEHLIAMHSELRVRWRGSDMHFSMPDLSDKARAYQYLNRLLKKMGPAEQDDFMNALRKGGKERFDYATLVLKVRHLKRLATDPLITIGAHTHNHLVLSRLSDIRLCEEIDRSRQLLETWLDRTVSHLAYPFGGNRQACKREFRIARELGFESAVTTRLGHIHRFHSRHQLALPRVAIGYQDCMARFEWKLSGLYCLARRPASRIRI